MVLRTSFIFLLTSKDAGSDLPGDGKGIPDQCTTMVPSAQEFENDHMHNVKQRYDGR